MGGKRTADAGADWFDASREAHWLYYMTVVLQVLFAAGFIFGVGLVLVTAQVTHTHFHPGQPNNNLYSERYTSLWWMALYFASMRFLFFLAMQSMFLYRNTVCCGNGQGCSIFWMMLLFGLCALDVIALAINSNFLATCNGKNAVGNPCNDPAWCCRPEVHSQSTNRCPNTLTCPGGGPSLQAEKLFLGIFALNVVYVTLELYFILLPLISWFLSPIPLQRRQQQQQEEEVVQQQDEEEEKRKRATETAAERALMTDNITPAPPLPMSAEVKFRPHRPAPRTPLLAAAAVGAPPTLLEKNTKQP
jgi:cell division protein FtsB